MTGVPPTNDGDATVLPVGAPGLNGNGTAVATSSSVSERRTDPAAERQGDLHAAVAILGIPFDKVSVAGAIDRVEQMIASRKPHFLVTANVDFLVQARSDVELRRILISADMVLCDGTPLVWASRILGNPLPERVAGADLVPRLIEVAARKSYKVFLLGGTTESAERAVERVRKKHPGIQIQAYSPPFNKLLDMDHEEIRARILVENPDLLFVSFGCPKQEKWILMHYRDLGVPVSVGVGATVDFLAEQVKRAPLWMQRSGTEWIYRLMQEPRRLAGRYSKDLWVFGRAFAAQLRMERAMWCNGQHALTENLVLQGAWHYGRLPEMFTVARLPMTLPVSGGVVRSGVSVLLDASAVRKIDATGLATLLRWRLQLRERNSALLLLAPSAALRRILEFTGLKDFFDIAEDMSSARLWIESRTAVEPEGVRHQTTASGFMLLWHGEVTAYTAEKVWASTVAILEERLGGGTTPVRVELNLRGVPFIDSTGLGILIRLRKRADNTQIELRLMNLQPSVINVVRLARLESFLLGAQPSTLRIRLPRIPFSGARAGNAA